MLKRTLIIFIFAMVAPASSWAFCGFFVPSGDTNLFTDATQVALMRHQQRTVLTMQNNFQGPPEKFALVVPVPEVLREENIKTLSKGVFDRLDQTTAPRLVEYFERDPCDHHKVKPKFNFANSGPTEVSVSASEEFRALPVELIAEFAVDEYDLAILSSGDSVGLEAWLKQNNYNIPDGAAPYLQPYIQAGMYFIVAKVDPERVQFENGRAVLSPLRFDYHSPEFTLPVRLGMINSNGEQDLIVYILGTSRFQAANRVNVQIPTNLEVSADVKPRFGEFYQELFTKTIEANAGAMVTEYAWPITRLSDPPPGTKCDPCPPPSRILTSQDMDKLGADLIDRDDLTITRLHTRYSKDTVGEDLRFEYGEPLAGGTPEPFTTPDGTRIPDLNRFQGRYIIRNPWTGGVTCPDPRFGDWSGGARDFSTSSNTSGVPLKKTPMELSQVLRTDLDELNIDGDASTPFATSSCFLKIGTTWIPHPLFIATFILAVVARIRRNRRLKVRGDDETA